MAKGFYVTPEAWKKLQSTVNRLQFQVTNLFRSHVGVRHAANGGQRFIEFSLKEDLSRGDTVKATHLPWEPNQQSLGEIEVTEKGKLSSGSVAPAGTTGYAIRVGTKWIIINLDCDELEYV